MTRPSEVWSQVGDEWDRALAPIISALKERNQQLGVLIYSGANDAFPLRAGVSFARDGSPQDEDLVISLDVSGEPDGYLARADIATGTGYILADAPAELIAHDSDPAALRARASDAVARLAAFIGANEPLLTAELRFVDRG